MCSMQAKSLLLTGSEAPLGSQRSSTASSQAGSSTTSTKTETLDDDNDPFLSEVSMRSSYWQTPCSSRCTHTTSAGPYHSCRLCLLHRCWMAQWWPG